MATLSADTLRRSWRAWLGGDRAAVGSRWLALLWTVLFSAAVAVGFTVLGFAAYAQGDGAWRNVAGWAHWYGINLVVSLCIGLSIQALFSIGYRLVDIGRVRAAGPLRRTLFFMGLPLLGVAIGWPLGAAITGYRPIGGHLFENPNALVGTLGVVIVITAFFMLLFRAQARQLQAERRAAEAQLRLLQGQIEPHFLFNTLANVLALIDHDAPRAKQMLGAFTDCLRSSLGSLRQGSSTLGSELDLVQAYLGLQQVRMEGRLQVDIDADPALRAARLPPLLLQPLVENAIHHGLEPKVEGGTVRVQARAEGGRLVLTVADDGLGLAAAPRRRGAGLALANLRERLLAHYGSQAGFELEAAAPGTRATLRLPLDQPLVRPLDPSPAP
ncbi:MAG: histidine kinase [Burkholderiales bacterium]|nr:histidine kinase [Burkholderiales bacterium]